MAGRWIVGRHYDATMSSPGWHAVAAGASDIGAMILVRAWERAATMRPSWLTSGERGFGVRVPWIRAFRTPPRGSRGGR